MKKNLNDCLKKYKYRSSINRYNIGDKVNTCIHGCHGGEIKEIVENTFYLVEYSADVMVPYTRNTKVETFKNWFIEFDLRPFNMSLEKEFTRELNWKDKLYISTNKKKLLFFSYMELEGHLDLNPEYQRNIVWTEKQRIDLIDSLFNLKNIGVINIIKDSNHNYEVLDGKQRLSAIFDFMKDKFKYKDKLYSELNLFDRETINESYLSYNQIELEIGDLTLEQKIELFIDLNTKGTSVSEEHIENIKKKFLK